MSALWGNKTEVCESYCPVIEIPLYSLPQKSSRYVHMYYCTNPFALGNHWIWLVKNKTTEEKYETIDLRIVMNFRILFIG